jgi:hypothetical protein
MAVHRLTAQLSRGDLPSCKLGNDVGVWRDHSVYKHATSDIVEGEVRYHGKTEAAGYLFDIVDGVGQLGLREWPTASVAEPTPGQSFWLNASSWYFVLRESQTGPVVLAGGAFSPEGADGDADHVRLVSQWLGTALALEPDCVYERAMGGFSTPTAPSRLFRVRLGDAPGVRIASGTSARFSIGGVPYDAWVSTERGNVPVTITRAP